MNADRRIDAPMTDAQRTQLQALAQRAGTPFDASLSYEQAARRIEDLRRGTPGGLADSSVGEEDPGASLGEIDAPRD